MMPDLNTNPSGQKSETNYTTDNSQLSWRAMFDFVENNTFPKIPGVDTAIISDLFSGEGRHQKNGRKIKLPTYYAKKRRGIR